MKIINLTPHDVVFVNENDESPMLEVFEASGNIARVEQFLFSIEDSKYNLKSCITGCVEGLPERNVDTVYIVSSMVREQLPDRDDLWSPTSFVRDGEGKIAWCTAFIVN